MALDEDASSTILDLGGHPPRPPTASSIPGIETATPAAD